MLLGPDVNCWRSSEICRWFRTQAIDTAALLAPWALSVVRRVLVPSSYHGAITSMDVQASGKLTVSRHGLDAALLVDGPNANNAFVYASSPMRGLQQVRVLIERSFGARLCSSSLVCKHGLKLCVALLVPLRPLLHCASFSGGWTPAY